MTFLWIKFLFRFEKWVINIDTLLWVVSNILNFNLITLVYILACAEGCASSSSSLYIAYQIWATLFWGNVSWFGLIILRLIIPRLSREVEHQNKLNLSKPLIYINLLLHMFMFHNFILGRWFLHGHAYIPCVTSCVFCRLAKNKKQKQKHTSISSTKWDKLDDRRETKIHQPCQKFEFTCHGCTDSSITFPPLVQYMHLW